MNRRGMTLFEVMVAIVILGLVVATFLELFAGALRGAGAAQTWSQAVAYATDGMERAKLEPQPCRLTAAEQLPGGFKRRCETRAWDARDAAPGLTALRVTVTLPDGRDYVLERLVSSP